MLQGFDLAPFSDLSCLRDTGLEPTDIPFSLTPVDLVPSYGPVGGRTNRRVRRLPFGRFRRPLPTMPSVFLAKGFPGVQGHDRFTTFHMSTMHGLGPTSPPVIVVSASGEL